MNNAKTEPKSTKTILPDYDFLFNENTSINKRRPGMLRKLFQANSKSAFICIFTYMLMNAPAWIVPVITAEIINLAAFSLNSETISQIVLYAVIIVLLYASNIPFCILNNGLKDRMVRRTSAGLKRTVIRRLQKLSITYYSEIETGRIQAKFLKDMDSIESLNMNLYTALIPGILSFIISIFISIYRSGVVTLFFLCVIPIHIFISFSFRNRLRRNSRDYRKENENMSAKVTTMLEMIPVTKAHGLEKEELVQLDKNLINLYGKGVQASKTLSLFGSTLWVISGLFSGTCLIFCVIMCMQGVITVGDVVLYQSLFASINSSITAIINSLPVFTTGLDAMSSISDIMYAEELEDDKNKLPVKDIKGELTFENVCYKYPASPDYVINDFNLHVKEGECIAVVGASGSGKTTLMNIIIGFLKPESGKLLIDGKSIEDISLRDYRHKLSVVPQNSILFSGSIKDNITYGLNDVSDDRLNEVIKMANIEEFLAELPNGIDTNIGEHGAKLSGGQKQRITIARALIRDPSILILDEATSALDNISEYHVQKAISSLIKGRTTFIVAHRLSTIREADRIVVMESGRCVEMGTYDELMAKRDKFYKLKTLNDMTFKKANESLENL